MRLTAQALAYRAVGLPPRHRPFVFGIGLSKTATTSLHEALKVLGYRAFDLPPVTRFDGKTVTFAPAWWAYKFEAWTDLSTAMVYRELWETFPNARFVYTVRDKASWLRSCERHFTPRLLNDRVRQRNHWLLELRLAAFGSVTYDRDLFSAAYDRHEAGVTDLMGGSDRFLRLDVIGGDGWAPLCAFLEKPVPQVPFPFSNRQPNPA